MFLIWRLVFVHETPKFRAINHLKAAPRVVVFLDYCQNLPSFFILISRTLGSLSQMFHFS